MRSCKSIIKGLHFGIMTAVLISLALTASASMGSIYKKDTKALKIRDNSFEVALSVLTPKVKVEEPISFAVRGNQPFYLYLFTVSKDSNKAYMILPNRLQQHNVYQANVRYVVPGKKLEFYSDRPGIEEVVMVATTKRIEVNRKAFKEKGRFLEGSRKAVDSEVKDLKIRAGKIDSRMVKQLVKIQVTENNGPLPAAVQSSQAVPFVGCNKNRFQAGEQMQIRVGADRAGYISLYRRARNGHLNLLREVSVDGHAFQRISVEAVLPAGEKTFIATWSKKKGDTLKGVEKGLRLTDSSEKEFAPFIYNVYP